MIALASKLRQRCYKKPEQVVGLAGFVGELVHERLDVDGTHAGGGKDRPRPVSLHPHRTEVLYLGARA